MSDLPRRLRASLKFDAINGDRSERSVCGLQMAEAARTIEDLEALLAAAEADAERYRWLRGHSFLIKDAIHFGSGARQHKPELLDAAIDKARGQE